MAILLHLGIFLLFIPSSRTSIPKVVKLSSLARKHIMASSTPLQDQQALHDVFAVCHMILTSVKTLKTDIANAKNHIANFETVVNDEFKKLNDEIKKNVQ